ncbi:MAG: polyhydroxybutyrate depolymerase [Pseudomonadota bacterium]
MDKAVAALALTLATSPALAACNGEAAPCETDLGTYHIVLPENAEGPIPAILYLHGVGGRGETATNNAAFTQAFLDRGYAVIGADGLDLPDPFGAGWFFLPQFEPPRDDIAFLTGIRDDAATRFGTDPDATILAGFSAGGQMANYAACWAPQEFAAFAPVAGGFWMPLPTAADCNGPVRLFHAHGWRDGTVPLEGRTIPGRPDLVQGDVFDGLDLWREVNTCASDPPRSRRATGDFWTRTWTDCAPGSALSFALYPGGHRVPQGWADMVVDWFETPPS